MADIWNYPFYSKEREYSASFAGQTVRYFTKPGIPDWEIITPASHLLSQFSEIAPGARVLLLGCRQGALAVVLAQRASPGEVWLADPSIVALQLSEKTLQANSITNVHFQAQHNLEQATPEPFDTVLLEIPKGRQLTRRWLVEGFNGLRFGGYLYLAGANEQGIRSAIQDAEALFGRASILGYKKGNRVARLIKEPSTEQLPGWVSDPGIYPGTWVDVDVEVAGRSMHLRSLPGVFSSNRLDEGTRLLLSRFEVPAGAHVLDLGCGYGLIGLLAAQLGAAHVDMVDANLLAIASAQANLELFAIHNAQAFPSDVLEAVLDRRYTLIVTNPPFHVGHTVDYQVTQAFIHQAWQVLEPGGQLLLVANKFIRYELMIATIFSHVERVAETGRYQLLSARKAI
jgi:16S rRNA (guanine1207-N2)-methyltransferase